MSAPMMRTAIVACRTINLQMRDAKTPQELANLKLDFHIRRAAKILNSEDMFDSLPSKYRQLGVDTLLDVLKNVALKAARRAGTMTEVFASSELGIETATFHPELERVRERYHRQVRSMVLHSPLLEFRKGRDGKEVLHATEKTNLDDSIVEKARDAVRLRYILLQTAFWYGVIVTGELGSFHLHYKISTDEALSELRALEQKYK